MGIYISILICLFFSFLLSFIFQVEDEVDEVNAKVFSELERKLQD